MTSIFGIRHHGPGSTKSMLKALHRLQPDLVLIEGPPDADKLIDYVTNEKLEPPVALLVYNPKDLAQAAYYPFARFSPEWQAMKYGLAHQVPVRFMDLPMAMQFGLDIMKREQTQIAIEKFTAPSRPLTKEERLMQKDPMAFAAKASGYTDSERWWEMMFERSDNPEAIFPAIIDLIGAMRKDLPFKSSKEQLREAYMRNTIRKAMKEGFQNIAVICGAWHAPVLEELHRYPVKTDNAILKGIKKVSTKATWVPWTFGRISTQSGYGSGVISPAYYQLLYDQPEDFLNYWMSKVAQLFRKEDMDASSAHVIEAVRLAQTTSSLRGLPVPGLEEMYEAVVSIFCDGYESKMGLIKNKLIIGDIMGNVPPEIPVIPLQQDLEKTIKSARLTKERNHLEKVEKIFDLRKPSNLLASHLLHRLSLLGIPWGIQKKLSKRDTGSFKEIWVLHWLPDFAINIIEAGMWGNTVFAAANNYIIAKAQDQKSLPNLTALIESALHADLPDAIDELLIYLKDASAITKDIQHLLQAVPALVNAVRYGSTRKMDTSSIVQVLDNIVPRACIGLPNSCMSINEDQSKELFELIVEVNNKLNVLKNEAHLKSWYHALDKISIMSSVNGNLRGGTTRILFDKEIYSIDTVVTKMRYALSRANNSSDAAQWLEGFLYGSGLLLIHQPTLWNILDEWVADLSMANFKELLPLLRRTFSGFSGPERAKMMDLAKRGQLIDSTLTEVTPVNQERAEAVIPTIKLLLGLK